MRKIIFKGKSQYSGEWLYGDLVHKDGSVLIHYPYEIGGHTDYMDEEVNPDTVCQFTGLKDRLGQDIYEGDRIQSETESIFEIGFDEGVFAARYIGSVVYAFKVRSLAPYVKVIGNKFDRK